MKPENKPNPPTHKKKGPRKQRFTEVNSDAFEVVKKVEKKK